MSDFTQENLNSVIKLAFAGSENLEIAKQLYLNFIYPNQELTEEFWNHYNEEFFTLWREPNSTFARLLDMPAYWVDRQVGVYIETVLGKKFGIYGLPGLKQLLAKITKSESVNDLILDKLTKVVGANPTDDIKWTVIGLNKWHKISGEAGYGFSNVVDHEFILRGTTTSKKDSPGTRTRGNRQYTVSVTFEPRFGSCGSGYCSASWGDCTVKAANWNYHNQRFHFLPIHPIPVELIQFEEDCYLITGIGNLAWSNGTGGDGYYPTGSTFIADEINSLFLPVAPERLLDKPNVYLFTGPSGIGKSYLAEQLGKQLGLKYFSVFETDEYNFDGIDHFMDSLASADTSGDLEFLYHMLSADMIVIGNKYKDVTPDKLIEIYRYLAKLENVESDIIVCNFSKK
jgi:hypothetical protein